MNRHVSRGLIVVAILLVAFWVKPANTQEQECFWEEAIDKTIVCDALIITIPVFHSMTSSQKADAIYTDEYIFLNDKSSNILSTTLDSASNFNAVTSGPDGQQTSLFTRGTNSNHTLVTINGSAITDHSTSNGLTDLNNINVHFADGLHLYTGPMSTNYGANAVGGVIDIQTNDVQLDNELSVSYGSNNKRTMSYSHSYDALTFGVYTEGTDGISVYPEGSEADGYDALGFNFGYVTVIDDTKLKFTGVTNNTKSDLDASGSDDTDYTADNTFHFGQVQMSTDVEYGTIKSVVDYTVWDRDYKNGTEQDSYNSNAFHSSLEWLTNTDQASTKTGMDTTYIDAKFINNGSYNSSVDKEADIVGFYHSFDYLTTNNFLISGGVRHDKHSIAGGQSTYTIGTAYNGFRISTSTGYKSPTLYELYGADNFGYTGNSNLKAETSISKEIGYNKIGSNYNFDIALYSIDIEDMITYSNSTYINDSTGTSTMRGADIDFDYRIGNLFFENNIALTSAQDSSNNWLKRRPHTVISSSVTYSQDSFYLTPSVLYYGKHKDTHSSNYSTITVDKQITSNLEAGYNVTDDSSVVLSINNIFDNDYERPHGYNQDGRNLSLAYKLKF